MCGSGRFLIPILEQGFDIEGIDASLEMLNSCQKKCRKKDLSPTLYYQKLQELTLPKDYGLIFIPAGSFGLIIDDIEIQESLKRLHSYLLHKGQLIIEIDTPYLPPKNKKINKCEVCRSDSSKIQLTTTTFFDIKTKIEISKCEYRNVVNKSLTLKETEVIKVKHYQINEFVDLLKSVSFSEIEALRPYSKEKATELDTTVLFQCLKSN